jgi:hypothetical protein
MFVGHFAVGMLAKRAAPRISLGTLVLAAVFADLVCFVLILFGIEHFITIPGVDYNRAFGFIQWSHSLAMLMLFWGVIVALAYYIVRESVRGAWIVWGLVVSHWVLDVISHRRDMQLAPHTGLNVGFGLWNSLPATLIVEGGFWLFAIILYLRATQPRTRVGIAILWIGLLLITLVGLSNPTQGIDPDPTRAGIGGLVVFSVFVAWAYWADHLRTTRPIVEARP